MDVTIELLEDSNTKQSEIYAEPQVISSSKSMMILLQKFWSLINKVTWWVALLNMNMTKIRLKSKVLSKVMLTPWFLPSRSKIRKENQCNLLSSETLGVVESGTVIGAINLNVGMISWEMKLVSMVIKTMVSSGWISMNSKTYTANGWLINASKMLNLIINWWQADTLHKRFSIQNSKEMNTTLSEWRSRKEECTLLPFLSMVRGSLEETLSTNMQIASRILSKRTAKMMEHIRIAHWSIPTFQGKIGIPILKFKTWKKEHIGYTLIWIGNLSLLNI